MATRAHTPWKHEVQAVWPYVTASTALMFVVCAAVGLVFSWRNGAQGSLSYVLATADPALAAITTLALGLFYPALFVGRRFWLPHVLTLPTVYVSVIFAVKTIAQTSSSAIQGVEGAGRFDLLWTEPVVVAVAWVAAAAAFGIVGVLSRPRPPEPVDSQSDAPPLRD